ncbi:hypothetical protein PENSPDRAFT_695170 [Peniophora sp. CONT]|nr:hypothetical protein PENSPDRAFT_695170 [Peniophora sp. CONT]
MTRNLDVDSFGFTGAASIGRQTPRLPDIAGHVNSPAGYLSQTPGAAFPNPRGQTSSTLAPIEANSISNPSPSAGMASYIQILTGASAQELYQVNPSFHQLYDDHTRLSMENNKLKDKVEFLTEELISKVKATAPTSQPTPSAPVTSFPGFPSYIPDGVDSDALRKKLDAAHRSDPTQPSLKQLFWFEAYFEKPKAAKEKKKGEAADPTLASKPSKRGAAQMNAGENVNFGCLVHLDAQPIDGFELSDMGTFWERQAEWFVSSGIWPDTPEGFKAMPEVLLDFEMRARAHNIFHVEHLKLGSEVHDFYMRDLIPAVRSLFGSPEFAKELLLSPERHYKDNDRTIRVYSEMNTGRWWWDRQKALEAGATVVPIIISTDKTQLTMFGNKSTYPVYLTIGNIPKSIRRKPSRQAQILIGYLPVVKLSKIKNKTSRRRALGNLFHACMRKLLEPVKDHADSGLAMARGDGVWFRCHPILACYVADYPEQVFVASTLNGDCVPGQTRHDALGGTGPCEPRNLQEVLDVFKLADGPLTQFHAACKANRLRPVHHPFWEQLPHCDIYRSITPDILHQLFQGVLAHIIEWVCDAYGAEVIDACCQAMPPNHNSRIFTNGISTLSRVTGTEHKDVCRILLGLILDLPLPNGVDPAPLIRCVRAMLDYANYAQYPEVTTETLDAMDTALELHHIRHYRPSFEDFGSSDNYNTEATERLHIDFTKTVWRKTNKKDAYYQMTSIIERSEALHTHQNYVRWRMRDENHPEAAASPLSTDSILHMHIQMTKTASVSSVSFDDLDTLYGAVDFSDALAYFAVKWCEPRLRHNTALQKADQTLVPQYPVSVFWKVKFWNHDALLREDGEDTLDTLHVRPAKRDTHGRPVPGRFDTALVKVGRTGEYGIASGLYGFRIGQVRVVFSLHKKTTDVLFPDGPEPPKHLAYIEWFTPFSRSGAERDSTLYRVSRSFDPEGRRLASIVPVTSLERTAQLYPSFGPVLDPAWTSFNVLERCTTFRVNHYLDHHFFRATH